MGKEIPHTAQVKPSKDKQTLCPILNKLMPFASNRICRLTRETGPRVSVGPQRPCYKHPMNTLTGGSIRSMIDHCRSTTRKPHLHTPWQLGLAWGVLGWGVYTLTLTTGPVRKCMQTHERDSRQPVIILRLILDILESKMTSLLPSLPRSYPHMKEKRVFSKLHPIYYT